MSSELQDLQPETGLTLPHSTAAPSTPSRRPWIWGLAAAAALGGGWLWYRARGTSAAARNQEAPAVRAVAVAATPARTGDMGISLTGLGTVTALNTVTVKSRVDGQLVRFPVQEGQVVRMGELIAEIDPRPFQVQLMQAEGQKAKDEAAFKNASADLARFKTLLDQGILSRQQYDAQASSVNQYEAALKADQAQVESAKLNLTYSRITAPISGKVGLRLVDPGNIVRASDASGLCVIAPVQPINVVFTIPADSVQRVLGRSGDGKGLPVEAYDRDLKTRLAAGTVAAVDNQVDPATGTVRIKALFDNRDNALFPNQFVNARLLMDTLKGAVIIPTAAIQRSPQGAFVYRITPENTAEMVLVDIRATDGESTAVSKGIQAGDLIATEGLERLRPGIAVAVAKSGGTKKAKS